MVALTLDSGVTGGFMTLVSALSSTPLNRTKEDSGLCDHPGLVGTSGLVANGSTKDAVVE